MKCDSKQCSSAWSVCIYLLEESVRRILAKSTETAEWSSFMQSNPCTLITAGSEPRWTLWSNKISNNTVLSIVCVRCPQNLPTQYYRTRLCTCTCPTIVHATAVSTIWYWWLTLTLPSIPSSPLWLSPIVNGPGILCHLRRITWAFSYLLLSTEESHNPHCHMELFWDLKYLITDALILLR